MKSLSTIMILAIIGVCLIATVVGAACTTCENCIFNEYGPCIGGQQQVTEWSDCHAISGCPGLCKCVTSRTYYQSC